MSGVMAMAADAGMAPRGAAMARGLERELEDSAAPSRSDRTFMGTLPVVGRNVMPERAEVIATMHRREDPIVTISDLIGWARFDCVASLPGVACPVHLVVGQDDLWLEADSVRRTADLIPGARFTLLEGIGHYPMEELSDAASYIDGCLGQLSGQPHARRRHGGDVASGDAPAQGAARSRGDHRDRCRIGGCALRDRGAAVATGLDTQRGPGRQGRRAR